MKTIRLTQIDGSLPNLALMKLSHYHKAKGHKVCFERSVVRSLYEPEYDKVYGSAIFSTSKKKVDLFRQQFPNALIGGTGTGNMTMTVESFLGIDTYEHYDYSIYPDFQASLGFSQRGCRLRCKFCVVPEKEGKVKGINTIADIYRGEPYPKHIILLDNDFFGQPHWRELSQEIIDGDYKVSFNQGINVRLIHQEGAEYLAQMRYMDDQFKKKRIYTAWDNRRDEDIFTKGINTLIGAGVRPAHIMVYMLCGYWPNETFDDVYYRFQRMVNMGLMPYPMVYGNDPQLKKFQRWVIRRYYQLTSWEDFNSQSAKQYKTSKSLSGTLLIPFPVEKS